MAERLRAAPLARLPLAPLLLVLATVVPRHSSAIHLRAAGAGLRPAGQAGLLSVSQDPADEAEAETAAAEAEAEVAPEAAEDEGEAEAPAEEVGDEDAGEAAEAGEGAPVPAALEEAAPAGGPRAIPYVPDELPKEPEEVQKPVLGQCELVDLDAPMLMELEECLCGPGEFWHWRTKRCVKQGSLGYECGFFPQELHKVVCGPGLACKVVHTDDHYVSHGRYKGQVGARPAVCVQCSGGDCCSVKPDCEKKITLSGDICVTVKVAKALPKNHSQEEEEGEEAEASLASLGSRLSLRHPSKLRGKAHSHGPEASIFRKYHAPCPPGQVGAVDEPEEEEEPEVKVREYAFSKGTFCVSVERAKQLLGISGIDHLDMKAAREALELGHHQAQEAACRMAQLAEPDLEENDDDEEAAHAAEKAAEEAVAAAAAEEETALEGAPVPSDDEHADEASEEAAEEEAAGEAAPEPVEEGPAEEAAAEEAPAE